MPRTDPRRIELLAIVDAMIDVPRPDHWDNVGIDHLLASGAAAEGCAASIGCWPPDAIRRVFAAVAENAPASALDDILDRMRAELDTSLRMRAQLVAEDAAAAAGAA
jgi:hypothetical protein